MYGMFTYFVHFYGKCIGKGANTWMVWDYYRYFFCFRKIPGTFGRFASQSPIPNPEDWTHSTVYPSDFWKALAFNILDLKKKRPKPNRQFFQCFYVPPYSRLFPLIQIAITNTYTSNSILLSSIVTWLHCFFNHNLKVPNGTSKHQLLPNPFLKLVKTPPSWGPFRRDLRSLRDDPPRFGGVHVPSPQQPTPLGWSVVRHGGGYRALG